MVKNFIIVGTQRTGSTALYHALNFHPDIACGGEWTQSIPWYKKIRNAQQALRGDFSGLTPRNQERIGKVFHEQTQWLGFKMLFRSSDKWFFHPRLAPALKLDQLENCLSWIRQHAHMHVIHIVRRDAVDWLKSKYLASTTGLFTIEHYPEDLKVKIPLHEAVKRLRAKNWIDHRLATLAQKNPYHQIHYEDFLKCNEEMILSVVQFLQCDTTRTEPIEYGLQQKQSTGEASDYIANYDELVSELERLNLLYSPLNSSYHVQ